MQSTSDGPLSEGCLDSSRAESVPRWAIIASSLNWLFIMPNLILLFLSLSDGWPPLLIFCSWQVAPLFLASSRNWSLITGKARGWLEGGCWLSEETAPQRVGEMWPSWFTCEKTKPLFPSAASSVKSTAAHADVASKGNKMSAAPASRLALPFFPPLLWVCVPQRCLLLHECPAAPRAGSVLPRVGVRAYTREGLAVGQLPMPGTPTRWE